MLLFCISYVFGDNFTVSKCMWRKLVDSLPGSHCKNENFFLSLILQRELAELDKLREDYVTSKADEPESRDGDILGED